MYIYIHNVYIYICILCMYIYTYIDTVYHPNPVQLGRASFSSAHSGTQLCRRKPVTRGLDQGSHCSRMKNQTKAY